MALVVITPPVAELLVSEQTIKEELGLTGTAQDSYLQRLIRRVSSQIVDYCGRPFAKQTVQETLVGSESRRLLLTLTPVLSITDSAIDLDGTTITDFTIENAAAGFLARDAGWPSTGGFLTALAGDALPGTAEPSIVVSYTGGYILETFNLGPATLPGDLEELAIQMVCDRYQNRGRDRTITQERLGDWGASYSSALATEIPARLASWRRIC